MYLAVRSVSCSTTAQDCSDQNKIQFFAQAYVWISFFGPKKPNPVLPFYFSPGLFLFFKSLFPLACTTCNPSFLFLIVKFIFNDFPVSKIVPSWDSIWSLISNLQDIDVQEKKENQLYVHDLLVLVILNASAWKCFQTWYDMFSLCCFFCLIISVKYKYFHMIIIIHND